MMCISERRVYLYTYTYLCGLCPSAEHPGEDRQRRSAKRQACSQQGAATSKPRSGTTVNGQAADAALVVHARKPQARPRTQAGAAGHARLLAAAMFRLGACRPGVNGPPGPASATAAIAFTATAAATAAAWPVAQSGPGRQPGAAGPAACMAGKGGSRRRQAGQEGRHPLLAPSRLLSLSSLHTYN